jgi:HSP90 family molecular chaperone
VYQAEIFPSDVRATAVGWTYSVSRLSSAALPFILVPLLDKDSAPDASEADKAVLVAVKAALGDQVSDVRASQRLTDSAACLVAATGGRDREL